MYVQPKNINIFQEYLSKISTTTKPTTKTQMCLKQKATTIN